MAFEESIEQYKKSGWIKRGLILVVLGSLYPLYFYNEESDRIEEQIEQAKSQLELAKKKQSKALQKKRDLPALQQKIADASAKIAEIKLVLPSGFNIDEVLREVASLAKEQSVIVRRFDPSAHENNTVMVPAGTIVTNGNQPKPAINPLSAAGIPDPSKVEKKYEEHPVRLDVEGTFMAITKFYDSLLHLGYLVHLRDVQYRVLESKSTEGSVKVVSSSDPGIKISSTANMIVFKSVGLGDL